MLTEFLALIALATSSGACDVMPINPSSITQIDDYSFSVERDSGLSIYMFGVSLQTELALGSDIDDSGFSGTRINTDIESKYFAIGSNTCSSNSYFQIGYLSMLGMPSIHYLTAISIDLPTIDHDYYDFGSAELYLAKRGGSGSVNAYLVSGVSYANINGTASYTTTFLASAALSNNFVAFDISDAFIAGYSNHDVSITILLDVTDTQSYLTCYSETSLQMPAHISYTLTNWGAAPVYGFDSNVSYVNCFDYAMCRRMEPLEYDDIPEIISGVFDDGPYTLEQLQIKLDDFSDEFEEYLTDHWVESARRLSSLTSLISSDERRIAMRIKFDFGLKYSLPDPIDFHFKRQCSDGCWSEKTGAIGDVQYTADPADPDHTWFPAYNSPTLYFAIGDLYN